MSKQLKNTRNKREKVIGFVYVSLLFLLVTMGCCICLFYYTDTKTTSRKDFVISKMDRIRAFQNDQNNQMLFVDSIYNKIKVFNPSVNASYEENDIKFYLNDIKRIYQENSYDGRYKIFYQLSDHYNMWFSDKKELWSKQQNIVRFKKNLEDCEIGLQKKTDDLKSKKR